MTPPRRPLAEEVADVSQWPLDEALSRAKEALAQSTHIAYQLAELLRRELEWPSGRSVPKVRRLLDILSGIGCEHHVLPVRSLLLSETDPYIRSKGTLMVGRASKSIASISRRLLDPDPRVQANAIEVLWGINTAEVREHLIGALGSHHSRVVANALVGLYRIQDLASISKLFALAEDPQEKFRTSARWAMGETGDLRFVPFLQTAFKTDEGRCRGVTLRSLKRLRSRLASLEQSDPLQIKTLRSCILPEGTREISFSVLRRPGEAPFHIGPMDVIVTEDSRLINETTVFELPDPDVLIVGIAVPRILGQDDPCRLATESGLERTLKVKPKRDFWTIDRYLSGEQREGYVSAGLADLAEEPVVANQRRLNRGFLTEPSVIAKTIPGPGPRGAASVDMVSSIKKLMDTVGRVSGSRHIFVFQDPEQTITEHEAEQLTQDAREIALSIHGITTNETSGHLGLKALCTATDGFWGILHPLEIGEEFPKLYQSLRNRYRITYQILEPAGGGRSAELSVYCPDGWGKLVVNLG